jgi:hypothetical protein
LIYRVRDNRPRFPRSDPAMRRAASNVLEYLHKLRP